MAKVNKRLAIRKDGSCEASAPCECENVFDAHVHMCHKPGRLYKDTGWFGTILCDYHRELWNLDKKRFDITS